MRVQETCTHVGGRKGSGYFQNVHLLTSTMCTTVMCSMRSHLRFPRFTCVDSTHNEAIETFSQIIPPLKGGRRGGLLDCPRDWGETLNISYSYRGSNRLVPYRNGVLWGASTPLGRGGSSFTCRERSWTSPPKFGYGFTIASLLHRRTKVTFLSLPAGV